MKRLALVGLLFACHHDPSQVRHALVNFVPATSFTGARSLTLIGGTDDTGALAAALQAEGITTINVGDGTVPADIARAAPTTRYIAGVRGMCHLPPYVEMQSILLNVEIYDVQTQQLVFRAKVSEDSDCAEGFYREIAKALASQWGNGGAVSL